MTIEVTRRQLMASAGGMVLASFALPSSLRKILESRRRGLGVRGSPARPLSEIEHVVVLMQENRSFDHYFGAMPGVRGFADPACPRAASTRPTRRTRTSTCSRSTPTPPAPAPRRCPPPATAGVPSTSPGTAGRWTGS